MAVQKIGSERLREAVRVRVASKREREREEEEEGEGEGEEEREGERERESKGMSAMALLSLSHSLSLSPHARSFTGRLLVRARVAKVLAKRSRVIEREREREREREGVAQAEVEAEREEEGDVLRYNPSLSLPPSLSDATIYARLLSLSLSLSPLAGSFASFHTSTLSGRTLVGILRGLLFPREREREREGEREAGRERERERERDWCWCVLPSFCPSNVGTDTRWEERGRERERGRGRGWEET